MSDIFVTGNVIKEAVWRCPKGHEAKGWEGPISWSPGNKKLCPQCLADFIEANIPEMKEQT